VLRTLCSFKNMYLYPFLQAIYFTVTVCGCTKMHRPPSSHFATMGHRKLFNYSEIIFLSKVQKTLMNLSRYLTRYLRGISKMWYVCRDILNTSFLTIVSNSFLDRRSKGFLLIEQFVKYFF